MKANRCSLREERNQAMTERGPMKVKRTKVKVERSPQKEERTPEKRPAPPRHRKNTHREILAICSFEFILQSLNLSRKVKFVCKHS